MLSSLRQEEGPDQRYLASSSGIARNLLQFGPSTGLFGEVIVLRAFLFWSVALYGIFFALRSLST